MDGRDNWLNEWQTLAEGDLRRWVALAAGITGAPDAPAGLGEAGGAFLRFAEDFRRLAEAVRGAKDAESAGHLEHELAGLAQDFFARAVPRWPALPGAGADWAAALQAWSMVLADIARATATAFAARLAAPGAPTTLRATFDAWIDCAEDAFRSAAHSDAFANAQARLMNEFVRHKARQQELLEQAARATGLPSRREVDALHDEVRALKAQLAARAEPPAPTRRPRAPRRTKR